MQSIHSIEGILFRSYLTGYNLSFLHKCIKANDNDYKSESFRKAAFANSDFDFERKVDRAGKLTESFIQYCERNQIKILSFNDEDYPKKLLAIKDFPPLVFVKGSLSIYKSAAVVGTREPSPLATAKTDFITKAFADHGYNIVSGLALGIDTMAHEAALQYKTKTIAVVPTSLDRIYPPANEELSKRIIENGGALISEQAPNYASVGNPFVLRNRIIAALSQYLVPVEMGKESGTMHTLQYAVRQNKKIILCLPGTHEINHHLRHYEGLIIAAKKYKKHENPNVRFIRDLNLFPQLLESDQRNNQRQLF